MSDLSWPVWSEAICAGTSELSLDVWSLWLSGLGLHTPRGAVLSETVNPELVCLV